MSSSLFARPLRSIDFFALSLRFGPNCTTFLVAAEVYPASIRATAHGVSAAVGKLGALAPTILYNYIGNQTKFWVVSRFASNSSDHILTSSPSRCLGSDSPAPS